MPTLYIENVPASTYDALRRHAKSRRRSIASIVVALLEESIPTSAELKARQELLLTLENNLSRKSRSARAFPSSDEMQRQDRAR